MNDQKVQLSDPFWQQWLLLAAQALSLAASAAQARSWFQESLPVEGRALTQMLAVQIVMCAALAPLLLSDWRATVTAAVPMLLFDWLAAWLGGQSSAIFAGDWTVTVLWLACGWALVSGASSRSRGILAAIISCFVMAPAVLVYLAADWGDPKRLMMLTAITPLSVLGADEMPKIPGICIAPVATLVLLLLVRAVQSRRVGRIAHDNLSTD